MKKNLVLLGMMGVGKSTIGKIVAKKQKLEFIDTDNRIEAKFSMEIVDIFKKKGEEFFRTEEEKEVLQSIEKSNCVIALGGGAFVNEAIRNQILKKTTSIWLDCDLKISEIFIENFFSILKSVSTNFRPCFFATILPRVDFPTPIIPNKTRFFFTTSRNFKFDFSQLCLNFRV